MIFRGQARFYWFCGGLVLRIGHKAVARTNAVPDRARLLWE
jgi:hypothetical protein